MLIVSNCAEDAYVARGRRDGRCRPEDERARAPRPDLAIRLSPPSLSISRSIEIERDEWRAVMPASIPLARSERT